LLLALDKLVETGVVAVVAAAAVAVVVAHLIELNLMISGLNLMLH